MTNVEQYMQLMKEWGGGEGPHDEELSARLDALWYAMSEAECREVEARTEAWIQAQNPTLTSTASST